MLKKSHPESSFYTRSHLPGHPTYLERVPVLEDNFNRVARGDIHVFTEPSKKSEFHRIALTNAQKRDRLRDRTENRTGFARRGGEHSVWEPGAEGPWKTPGMCTR